MDDSARQIRLRIFGLILRAFIGVLIVTVLLVIFATGIALSNNINLPPNSQLSIIPRLEGYYVGHGSWDGVENAVKVDLVSPKVTLLDSEGQVVLDQGDGNVSTVGKPYQIDKHDIIIELIVEERKIGMLVFDRQTGPSQFGAVTNILNEEFVESVGYSTRGRNFKIGLNTCPISVIISAGVLSGLPPTNVPTSFTSSKQAVLITL